MYVKDWMTHTVHTVDIKDGISTAVKLMHAINIKHVPVMDHGKVVGLISDRALKEYLPSKSTTLDVFELNYLLDSTNVKELIKHDPIVCEPSLPIEEAANLMLVEGIGCLPVVEDGRLVGIISDKDIFKALVDITGGNKKGYRITFVLVDRSGSIKEAANVIRDHKFGIESILSGHVASEGMRKVVIRSRGEGDGEAMCKAVLEKYPDAEIQFRG